METSPVSLGYVILYVTDVQASLTLYEQAFGLSRRFFHEEDGRAYGELETGTARLSFASIETARSLLNSDVVAASLDNLPLGSEIALLTTDVPALYQRAVGAGATSMGAPETKPWGQTVAYLRDRDGHLVELCTPLP